jgi:L-serine dehydratase
MYENAAQLLKQLARTGKPLYQIIVENETRLSECGEEEIRARVFAGYEVMCRAAKEGPDRRQKTMIAGQAGLMRDYMGTGGGICGKMMQTVMFRALSCLEVNASMGKICAAPTAGACGILPAVVITLADQLGCGRTEIENALITASGIGAIVMANATVSGAEGGCQAECGVAAAMAAGAAVCMKGGSARTVFAAASLALMSAMGLVCDPVGGYVQIPCAYRNATQALCALGCADMALAGIDPKIPFDEVVQAMGEVGSQLPPALRETAEGGVAATPSGKKLAAEIQRR